MPRPSRSTVDHCHAPRRGLAAGRTAGAIGRSAGIVGLAQPAEPPVANRTELEAAADALLAHSLAGRRTDDELLGAVLALWDEHEGSMVHGDERLVHQGITWRRAQTRAMLSEVEAWRKRYRLAWRRWSDQHAEHGSATSPGQR